MQSMNNDPTSHRGPLAGMRVLELAQIMAGPTCGMLLADMGADVIKVEKLPGGDDARGYREPRVNGESAPFLVLNRNKRGIALNLKHAAGREVLLKLVERADVLTENFRKGTLEKLGLGYDVLAQVNPGLIYCAISGYGRTGPFADKGGFDLIAQGFAGLMSITGEPGGPRPRPATRWPTSMAASSPRSASPLPMRTSSRPGRARWSTRR
jgi:crotonobetainyl-CoA:carnitine CoA-transferase CaiB-like acyl-CoA transferase